MVMLNRRFKNYLIQIYKRTPVSNSCLIILYVTGTGNVYLILFFGVKECNEPKLQPVLRFKIPSFTNK